MGLETLECSSDERSSWDVVAICAADPCEFRNAPRGVRACVALLRRERPVSSARGGRAWLCCWLLLGKGMGAARCSRGVFPRVTLIRLSGRAVQIVESESEGRDAAHGQ